MKLVIDIQEEDYNFVTKQVADGITNPLKICIANGTPLPENHGRIIDESKITSVYYHIETYENGLCLHHTVIDGTNAPTIIEADKGESEDEG